MGTTRRDFMIQGVGGATLVAGGFTLPGFLWRTASAARPEVDESVLVVIQMTGGNDGLNTVIPFTNDVYHRARPTLRIAPDDVVRLDGELGLHPQMTAFKRLYDQGALGVISNVGYPNPDRSHFRSMDIWHCGCAEPEHAVDGWLGRVVDRHTEGREVPLAINLDDGPLPLALHARSRPVPSIKSLDAFRLRADPDVLAASAGASRDAPSDDLLYVQRLTVSSCENAKRIKEVVSADAGSSGAYPDYRLASRLRQIAQLIGADFGARIYYTSIGGFDTHARQALAHGQLLRELSESIAAFHSDLRRRGQSDRVVLMTFSEFGRRVDENGSQGTDHGAGAPMFIVGDACRAGVTGGVPNLENLLEGDVRHEIDFRRVYATLLDDWLGVDPTPILGQHYPKLDLWA